MSRLLYAAALSSSILFSPAHASTPFTPTELGEDILQKARDWQAAPNRKPPTEFRAGHVTPRTLDKGTLQAKAGGFEIALPSGAPITTPTVYDGKVFSSGGFHSKEFYAVDAKTGQLVWGLDLDDDGPSSAACDEGRCAFNTESCTLFVVDANTGKQVWSLWLGDPLTSAPAIADGRVYASYPAGGHPSASHVLAAFDLQTGRILWQRWIDSDVQSAAVVVKGKVYASTFGGSVYELDAKTGEFISARQSRATSAPTIAGGDIHYSARADKAGGHAQEALATRTGQAERKLEEREAKYLDQETQQKAAYAQQAKSLDAMNGFGGGAPISANATVAQNNIGKASVSSMQSHQGSRVLSFEEDLVAAMGDEIVSTDNKTGKTRWKRKIDGDMAQLGGALVTPLAAAGEAIFVGTTAGEVWRLDPKSGEIAQRWTVGGPVRSQPVIEGGWIYVGTENGRLVGIDTKNPEFTGWATWGGDAARTGVYQAKK
jgi:outer membrane protein assembly factor BamB